MYFPRPLLEDKGHWPSVNSRSLSVVPGTGVSRSLGQWLQEKKSSVCSAAPPASRFPVSPALTPLLTKPQARETLPHPFLPCVSLLAFRGCLLSVETAEGAVPCACCPCGSAATVPVSPPALQDGNTHRWTDRSMTGGNTRRAVRWCWKWEDSRRRKRTRTEDRKVTQTAFPEGPLAQDANTASRSNSSEC